MRQKFYSTPAELRRDYEVAKGLGAPMLQCNAMLVPEIAPELRLLFKSYPRPILTNNDKAEVAYAGGLAAHVPGTIKTSYEGAFTIIETEKGIVADFADLLAANNGTTNCLVYDGRYDRWTKVHELTDCALTLEPGEVDAESRSQIMTISGNMSYMFFGQSSSAGIVSNAVAGGIQIQGTGNSELLTKAQNLLNLVKTGVDVSNSVKNLF
ncbi:hypothetical protein [Acinetobacter sp. 272263]|uniref:hypothetical protein n=1 Tax=Acinetobacter sp. 272263 TaxID=1310639 RepID=UPI00044B7115|nr:hypothetical protein [Acinetobacter sp. 272263]EXB84790.1 hypothetical protein J538_1866 [Acinetobacter sp. 272263]